MVCTSVRAGISAPKGVAAPLSRRVLARAEDTKAAAKAASGDAVKPGLSNGSGAPPPPSPDDFSSGTEFAKNMAGISAPTGYFDPVGLAGNTSPEQVKRYRESEITHGRVCMLAAVGILVGEAVEDKTLFYNWDGGISGPAIVHFQQTKPGFWEPLVLCIGIAEAYRVAVGWADPTKKGVFTLKDDYRPGDLGFDPFGICPTDKKEFDTMQTKEINNGRLAMIATAGFVAQELVNKKGIVDTLQEKIGF